MNWGRYGAMGLKEEAEYSIHLESFKEIGSSLLAFVYTGTLQLVLFLQGTSKFKIRTMCQMSQ